MQTVQALGPGLGVAPTCRALGVPRATYYRSRRSPACRPARRPPRSLGPEERHAVLAVLHEPRFADQAPPEVYATLLDEGQYLCSVRTMYRLLAAQREVRERRDVLQHPRYAAPELLATRPNELWSWDITKLLGPAKWTYYYLYVILDVFSRYVVGWLIAYQERASLAERLLAETCRRQGIAPGQLTIHADRGAAMTSKPVAFLLADLGITKTHARPHVANDNPYSEAQFKTLKYRPEFPDRFGSLEHARAVGQVLLTWYNEEHHHAALGYLTPADVHCGRAAERRAQRAAVLAQAYARRPERFVRGVPTPAALPAAVWINPPTQIQVGAPPQGLIPPGASEIDLANCPRSDDRDGGRHPGTPDFARQERLAVVQ